MVLHAAAPNYLDKHSRPDKLKSKDNSGLQRENLSKCVTRAGLWQYSELCGRESARFHEWDIMA